MAKYHLRIRARKERAKGESVNKIAKKLGVSKGTVSLWVRDIILSVEQLEELRNKSLKGGELGRFRGAMIQKQRRLEKEKKYKVEGEKRFRSLNKEGFFTAGLALYWAEGSKKTRSVQFCNSDPNLVNFMIRWFEKFFKIDLKRLSVKVGINEIHRSREQEVKKYWSKTTGIPTSQFRKTSFKKTKTEKTYANHETHFGTLSVNVLQPGDLYYRIMGLIHGLGKPA